MRKDRLGMQEKDSSIRIVTSVFQFSNMKLITS